MGFRTPEPVTATRSAHGGGAVGASVRRPLLDRVGILRHVAERDAGRLGALDAALACALLVGRGPLVLRLGTGDLHAHRPFADRALLCCLIEFSHVILLLYWCGDRTG